mmetsp:Transcript_4895/g.11751  ORF Transcript_4895/g.11751 Transcript_4895/m.11751 type:complete len:244 (+) Transcript_4895:1-732(+)
MFLFLAQVGTLCAAMPEIVDSFRGGDSKSAANGATALNDVSAKVNDVNRKSAALGVDGLGTEVKDALTSDVGGQTQSQSSPQQPHDPWNAPYMPNANVPSRQFSGLRGPDTNTSGANPFPSQGNTLPTSSQVDTFPASFRDYQGNAPMSYDPQSTSHLSAQDMAARLSSQQNVSNFPAAVVAQGTGTLRPTAPPASNADPHWLSERPANPADTSGWNFSSAVTPERPQAPPETVWAPLGHYQA